MIVEHFFATAQPSPFSLSRQIKHDKPGYYAALQEGRKGRQGQVEATPFVAWFLEALAAAADSAPQEALHEVSKLALELLQRR
ncbi:hypothetical protein MUY35_11440 [Aliiroseovarius sp. S1339]|uniref:hypothetical protein n=1 Tax=Aliiroseovarius sp. S1339 TaxID=2936990 RepID=UPI0020BE8A72|nr:hypothetical protein [Aliiroseovarius sp. S1339]MCK8464464.1 hypothetical protein [Aliiroseovarius sp. S1339]